MLFPSPRSPAEGVSGRIVAQDRRGLTDQRSGEAARSTRSCPQCSTHLSVETQGIQANPPAVSVELREANAFPAAQRKHSDHHLKDTFSPTAESRLGFHGVATCCLAKLKLNSDLNSRAWAIPPFHPPSIPRPLDARLPAFEQPTSSSFRTLTLSAYSAAWASHFTSTVGRRGSVARRGGSSGEVDWSIGPKQRVWGSKRCRTLWPKTKGQAFSSHICSGR